MQLKELQFCFIAIWAVDCCVLFLFFVYLCAWVCVFFSRLVIANTIMGQRGANRSVMAFFQFVVYFGCTEKKYNHVKNTTLKVNVFSNQLGMPYEWWIVVFCPSQLKMQLYAKNTTCILFSNHPVIATWVVNCCAICLLFCHLFFQAAFFDLCLLFFSLLFVFSVAIVCKNTNCVLFSNRPVVDCWVLLQWNFWRTFDQSFKHVVQCSINFDQEAAS